MKYLLVLVIMGFQAISLATDADKDGRPLILFETKIYRVDGDTIADKPEAKKASQVLEGSPSLIARAGDEASIEIGVGEQADSNDEKIVMRFIPNERATLFDVKLELLNGDNTMISHIEGSSLDKPLKFSAKLNEVTRLFALNATLVSSELLAANGGTGGGAAVADENACGRVSVFRQTPINERYFGASIVNVNDNNVDTKKTTHRVPPGKNQIQIFPHSGGFSAAGSRSRFRGKIVEIDVKPNMTYHLGAKFNAEKRYRTRNQEDWEPVVWKITEESCSL